MIPGLLRNDLLMRQQMPDPMAGLIGFRSGRHALGGRLGSSLLQHAGVTGQAGVQGMGLLQTDLSGQPIQPQRPVPAAPGPEQPQQPTTPSEAARSVVPDIAAPSMAFRNALMAGGKAAAEVEGGPGSLPQTLLRGIASGAEAFTATRNQEADQRAFQEQVDALELPRDMKRQIIMMGPKEGMDFLSKYRLATLPKEASDQQKEAARYAKAAPAARRWLAANNYDVDGMTDKDAVEVYRQQQVTNRNPKAQPEGSNPNTPNWRKAAQWFGADGDETPTDLATNKPELYPKVLEKFQELEAAEEANSRRTSNGPASEKNPIFTNTLEGFRDMWDPVTKRWVPTYDKDGKRLRPAENPFRQMDRELADSISAPKPPPTRAERAGAAAAAATRARLAAGGSAKPAAKPPEPAAASPEDPETASLRNEALIWKNTDPARLTPEQRRERQAAIEWLQKYPR